MARGFEVRIDVSREAEEVTALIDVTAKQLDLASKRAMTKVGQWLRTHSMRELSQQLGIKQASLRKRFRVYPQHHNGEVRFWVGLDPIGVYRLGTPKITNRGVKVNRNEYEGAFINPMESHYPLVFKRRGKERLPIDLVNEDIDEPAIEVIERWERRVFQKFKAIFEQETRTINHGHA